MTKCLGWVALFCLVTFLIIDFLSLETIDQLKQPLFIVGLFACIIWYCFGKHTRSKGGEY